MPATLPTPVRRAVKSRLRPVVAQLIRDLVAEENDGEAYVDEATDVLLARIGGMAPHLATGMVGLTLTFDSFAALRGGRSYAGLGADQRAACLDLWRGLPGPLGSWSQFYEKMGTFAYWSVVEEREHGAIGAAPRSA